MELTKIVITGGPCAGKSVALDHIQKVFTQLGYTVLVITETATDLIKGGVAPWTCGTSPDFQGCQMELQMAKERVFERAARTMHTDKVLLVLDRSCLDGRAYISGEDFAIQAAKLGCTEGDFRNRYDAVFHLSTAALGAPDAYTLANNSARIESLGEAVVQDSKTLSIWVGHPHLRIIPSTADVEVKLQHLVDEISAFLGLHGSLEIERKFLIRFPDIQWLEQNSHCRRAEIEQVYLPAQEGSVYRIRRRSCGGSSLYYETIKRSLGGIRREEIEHRISQEEYQALLAEAGPQAKSLSKHRYCLAWNHTYYEIDSFPFWTDRAVVEVELLREDQDFQLPPQLQVVREVSEDPAYLNVCLADGNPPMEPI